MPRLSVVMIVKNEAECLERCLDSVRAIADEIVVADTGSTDKTIAIAERCGAKVYTIPWTNDFAEARNRALAFATGDWVLHMDADEMLDPDGARSVRSIVEADGEGADAIEVIVANYSDDPRAWRWAPVTSDYPSARGHAGYIPVSLLRLFRNGRGFHYREAVHENITESVHEGGGVIRAEPIAVHHYGYARNAAQKGRDYLAMAREKARERPRDAKAWHDLAEQLLALGETGEAECAARRVIECEPSHLGATTTLANILLNRGALDEAKSLLEPLATSRVDVWHVRTALGAIACKQGRLADARHHLENVVEDSPTALMARLYLARALDLLGDAAKARNHLRQAVELTPSLNEVTDRLAAHGLRGEAHRAFDAGNTRESLRLLVEALKRDPEDPLIHFALGVVMRALNECVRAEESFGRAKALAPSVAAWDAGSWPPVTNE